MISLFVLISWNLFPPQILKECTIRWVGYLIPLFQRTRLVGDAGAFHSAALELCEKLRKAIDLGRGRSWGEGKSNGQSSKEIFNRDSGKSQLANHPVNSWTKLCTRVNSVFSRLNAGQTDFTRQYVFRGERGPMGSQ